MPLPHKSKDNPLVTLAKNQPAQPKLKPKIKFGPLAIAKAKPEYDRVNMERQMGGLSKLPPIEDWMASRKAK